MMIHSKVHPMLGVNTHVVECNLTMSKTWVQLGVQYDRCTKIVTTSRDGKVQWTSQQVCSMAHFLQIICNYPPSQYHE